MTRIIFMHVFYGKRRIVYFSLFVLLMLSIFFMGYTHEPVYLQQLEKEYYLMYFILSLKTFYPFIFSITITMLLIDHDQNVFHMLYAYHSRFIIYFKKLFAYGLIMTHSLLFTFLIMHLFMISFTAYYAFDLSIVMFFLHLWCDGLILIILFLIIIKKEHINRGFLVLLLYFLFPMIKENMDSRFLFYIFPIYTMDLSNDLLVYAYKICYICFGILIGYVIHEKMSIY